MKSSGQQDPNFNEFGFQGYKLPLPHDSLVQVDGEDMANWSIDRL
jgi:hypothetical protein